MVLDVDLLISKCHEVKPLLDQMSPAYNCTMFNLLLTFEEYGASFGVQYIGSGHSIRMRQTMSLPEVSPQVCNHTRDALMIRTDVADKRVVLCSRSSRKRISLVRRFWQLLSSLIDFGCLGYL